MMLMVNKKGLLSKRGDELMIPINTYNKTVKIPRGWLMNAIKDYEYQGLDEFLSDYTYDLGEILINSYENSYER